MKPAVIVAGMESLGLAIVERVLAAGAEVRGIAAPADALVAARELERLGASVVTGSPRSVAVLEAAGLASASTLVLAADNDAENVDAALLARRLRPGLPLVVRLFNPDLTGYLGDTLPGVTVLSVSRLGAPVFAELALRALEARVAARAPRRPRAGRLRRRPLSIDRTGSLVFLGLFVIVVGSSLFFAHALGLRLLDAVYFVLTTITTVGYGDISLRDASDTAKLVGMGVMFAGAAFIATLFALLNGAVVARRLDFIRGRVPVRGRGHIVVAGAGHVGLRVTRLLAARGHRVVAVERNGASSHVSVLQAEGHHVIVADAALDETLDLAGIDRAAAVLALTDSDATNVHVALAARRRQPELPIVVRLASPELSAHVAARGNALTASSIAIASEAFARAALDAAGSGSAGATRGGPGGCT